MPSQVVIENPIINSPFAEPERHFRFDEDGTTDQLVKDCRVNCYFIPLAQTLEDMDEVVVHVKDHNRGVLIPYTTSGDQRHYMPDSLACLDDGRGPADPLNLIVEVTGERDKDKAAKVATARNLWVPAVKNAGTWGRWAFIEIADPWDATQTVRRFLKGGTCSPHESR